MTVVAVVCEIFVKIRLLDALCMSAGVSKGSLAHVETLHGGFVIELLQGCESGTSVVLRAAAALFVTEVLAGVRSEEPCFQTCVRSATPRARVSNTHRHAPHSRSCASSSTGYRARGMTLPGPQAQALVHWT